MDARPIAFITGIAGQDGSYLAELLLRKKYIVHGLIRRSTKDYPPRLLHLLGQIHLHHGEITDQQGLAHLLHKISPTEVYHLAAQSVVATSWQHPVLTADVTALGTLCLLEALRLACPSARFCQPSSSEQFGNVTSSPQNESAPFRPRNLYGVSKVFAHQATVNYRQHYDLFACCGILYNHESPRRGKDFVTRRVSRGVAEIKTGQSDQLTLGCLTARRDWGYAGDYVEAMWRMLQQDTPDDYVIGTGKLHSVEELVSTAFDHAGLDWREWVQTDANLLRPPEEVPLCADPGKAQEKLGWSPVVGFRDLIAMMVDADLLECEIESPSILSMPSRQLKKSA